MANQGIFKTMIGKLIPSTDTRNHENAPAYALSPAHALAQLAVTGCFNGTFYADGAEQLDAVLELANRVEPEVVAKIAIHCREAGYMKDMPALLVAVLSVRDRALFEAVFPRVVDNGKMLRNFVQIVRSGVVGRKSLGSLPKRMVREWLEGRSDDRLLRDSVGQSPSIADVVKMVHPKPASESRQALYAYLLGHEVEEERLPRLVRELEAFRSGREGASVPDVPFQLLTSQELDTDHWIEIARHAPWQMTRMNLNTFARHGVFEKEGMTEMIADRIRNPALVATARVFPYQLLVAYTAAGASIPQAVKDALHDAMEIAIGNVPAIEGRVYVCPDVSGSMRSAATGFRKGATSAVRCVDVAALVAAAIVRKNPNAEVLPFEHRVVSLELEPRDTVMTNARRLASIGGGGTNCSAPLQLLNQRRAEGDLVIFVSDNESWVDARAGRGTALMHEWNAFRQRNRDARLVCLDVQPYRTTQATERDDILNVGGFSDRVFDVVAAFAQGELDADHWLGVIEKTEIRAA